MKHEKAKIFGCPICNKGEMKKRKDVMKQDGVEFEAFQCNNCGEEIMNMKQLKVLAGKYRKLREAKEVTFAKWGNSVALRIPSEIVEDYNIVIGEHATLMKEKAGFRIVPQ